MQYHLFYVLITAVACMFIGTLIGSESESRQWQTLGAIMVFISTIVTSFVSFILLVKMATQLFQ